MIIIMDDQKKMLRVFVWAIQRTGLNQACLADLLGCSQPNISQIKNGHHAVKYVYLKKLAEILKTDKDLPR